MDTSGAQQRLEEALELAESGRKQEAKKRFRALVAEGARLPKAAMALGVLCGERGELAERRLWLLEARRLEESAGGPPSLRLLLNLQVDALEHNEPEQAMAYGEEALALAPEDGEAHLYQARVLVVMGRTREVSLHLEQACMLLRLRLKDQPDDVKAWRLLAMAELNSKRFDSAIEAQSHALRIDPNHLPSLVEISRLLIHKGQVDHAMPWLMNALANAPDDPDVLTLNGCALRTVGELSEAILLLQQALIVNPAHKEAALQLGDCLCEQGLFVEAASTFRDGLSLRPGDFELKSGLAASLRQCGDFERAIAIYREVLEEFPESQLVFNNLMFTFSISDIVPHSEVLETAKRFWKGKCNGITEDRPLPTIAQQKSRPLKVGLLSADIGSHVVGRFLDPLLRHHDPNRCQLELISMKRRYESSSESLISMADKFHSLEGLPLDNARDLLKQQNYDLILDTSGYTRGTGLYLLADRCAPVQAHYIGYHATTGLPTIDWFIGDGETAAHELQVQFSERLWRLPRPWLAYPSDPPFPEAESLVEIEKPILGCFCQVSKISETTLTFWGEILRRSPEALLVLKDRGLQDKGVRDLLEEKLTKHGISQERIRFLPPAAEWRDHLEFYNILDIALDTTPWSSATTAFEALGMGVPLVAIRGDCTASRMSSSVVKGVGRQEWVAETPLEASRIVNELCQDIYSLRANKKRLQHQVAKSALWDGIGLSSTLMDCFEKLAGAS